MTTQAQPTHVATFACRFCQAEPFASLTAFLAHVRTEHGRGPTEAPETVERLTVAEWRRRGVEVQA